MKEIIAEGKRKQKNPTTNYPKDTHKSFCERCFKFNHGCPVTKRQYKDRSCSL